MNSHSTPRKSNSSKLANLPIYSNSKFLSQTSHSPKQNFIDSSVNKLNSKTSHMDSNFSLQDNITEHNIHSVDRTKKKEANFKHILNVHHISDIIAGKRTRRPPDEVIKTNGNPQQNLPDNSRLKSSSIIKKRGRPPTNRKPITLHKAFKRQTPGTRKHQNGLQSTHSNFTPPQISTRRSQRRMPTTPSIIEKKAIPAKKLIKELPMELSNTTNDDSKKDAQEPEEEYSESDEEAISEGSDESEVHNTRGMVNEYAITRAKRSPQGQVVNRNERDKRKISDEKGEVAGPQTLLTKIVNKDFVVENYLKFDERVRALNAEYTRPATYVNCDLRYFNFDFLVDKLGYFDIIIMDPPWRIKGAQQNDSSFMFSNSKFNLEYDTLSNQEIMNLKVERLSKKGFLFLWILSNQINTAYEMMNKWGYEVVDQLVWVKLKDKKIYLSHGYYFMHSFEMCLIGYKCPPGEQIEYNTKICNDVLFGEVRAKSQKPEELYEIADMLMPGSKKIELFARNHNLRPGWFSLGNQLGETYEKWYNIVNCDNCNQPIYIGIKRYKARHEPDYDLCEKCFESLGKNLDDFFQMNNLVNEDVLHKYHSCNHCMTEPIWGIRFACIDCENFDLCECCFDKNLHLENKFHDIYHNFRAVEIPILANGLPAHYEKKCSYCFQKPILGVCFSCAQCPNLHFCQNCFFSKPHDEMKKFRGHKSHHGFNILAEPVDIETRLTKCSWCEICPIQGTSYKCENCYSFYFCEKCYQKRDGFKPNTANTHKFYHTFTTVDGPEFDVALE